ncbi:MAG: glycosyltransferase family 4 protein [Minisyncoccia bacterium]
MKIIIATPIYPPEIGGPATYTKELCERLHKEHDITIITYTDSTEVFPGTKLIAISKQDPLATRLRKYFFAVWKESKNADLIYVQNAMASGFPVAIVSIFRRMPFILKFVGDEAWERATQLKLTKKRLEEFLENPDGNLKTNLMMILQGFVLRRATIITTPSLYLGKEIVKAYGIKPERNKVNYNAAEESVVLPFATEQKKHQIATTARLVAWKGIDGIVKALALIKKNFPDATLVVAGEGPEMENVKALVKKLNLENSVSLLGKISRAETWQLRKNSEIYVLNSTYEGLPHTVLTSFAAMIPTIATNIPGTNEALYHEDTGLLVEPGDTRQLAKAIERLFTDKELCNRLVKNADKLLKEKFSWENHVKTLNGFFHSVLSKPRN